MTNYIKLTTNKAAAVNTRLYWLPVSKFPPPARHRMLVDIEMQPKFSGLSVGPEVTRRLQEGIQRAAGW